MRRTPTPLDRRFVDRNDTTIVNTLVPAANKASFFELDQRQLAEHQLHWTLQISSSIRNRVRSWAKDEPEPRRQHSPRLFGIARLRTYWELGALQA